MDMPTPSDSALTDALNCIKPEIRSLTGYTAPPQGSVVAKLNQNENPYDIPAAWKAEIFQRMQETEWPRYPQYSPESLRNRLARRFNVRENQILLGHGSNQLLYLIGSSVILPGDRVVMSPPTFSLFDLVMRIYQANLEVIPKLPDFSLNMEAIINAAGNAKLTFLCSPDNPTGTSIPLSRLREILDNASGLVLWDEAYAEFGGESAVSLLGTYPNLIVSRTFSKAFGLAGLRVGYFIGHPEIIRELQKANIPYNVNLFSLLTCNYMLDHAEWMDTHVGKIIRERQKLFDRMYKIPHITPYPSEANFILFQVNDKNKVFGELKSRGILVRDVGSAPPLDRCLRVTVGTPEENDIFINALESIQ
ncbi:histidinol-phosphate transaminase [bacterium]|nr:histidinol-phosphate transaminase [bacterium]